MPARLTAMNRTNQISTLLDNDGGLPSLQATPSTKSKRKVSLNSFKKLKNTGFNFMMMNGIKKYATPKHGGGGARRFNLDDDSESMSCSTSTWIQPCHNCDDNQRFSDEDSSQEIRKSAMKGGERSNEFVHRGKHEGKPKRKVARFPKKASKLNTFHTIQPYFAYAKDLWWTKSELELCRDELFHSLQPSPFHRSCSASDYLNEIARLRCFLNAYQEARIELAEFEAAKEKLPKNMRGNRKISTESYNEIVRGYDFGFNGLEKYVGFDLPHRRERIRRIVGATTAYYYSIMNDTSSSIDRKLKLLSHYSRALTSHDRYWAVVTGNAASAISLTDEDEEGDDNIFHASNDNDVEGYLPDTPSEDFIESSSEF